MTQAKMTQTPTRDKPARRAAAQLLRDFIAGRVTNDDFEDNQPHSQDRAIHALWDTAWVFYDDRFKHKLIGQYRLPPDQRRACIRWLLFLHSDLEYLWPDLHLPGIDPARRIQPRTWLRRLQRACLAPVLSPEEANQFLGAGHYPVWPFLSKADYKTALRNPRLLSGQNTR